ncbi:transporter substrate-binding domain-containing protein [Eubacteriaceae bacterium ES3]|nr:transporter substrate-binding domain-containing protein [Eubacteriaceae bacterium ES3]
MISKKNIITPVLFLLIMVLILMTGCESQTLFEDDTNKTDELTEIESLSSNKLLILTSEYKPYTSEELVGNGFFTRIIEEVLEEADLEYEVAFYPWERGLEMVENGQAFATFPYIANERRKEAFLFSDGVVTCRHRFYILKANQDLAQQGMNFTQLGDFSGYTFGGANGYWYGTKEDVEKEGLAVEWANDTEALFKMLYSGRIDFIIEDELVADLTIARLFPDDTDAFMILPNVASTHDYHMLVSRDYPDSEEFLEKFNAALQKLKDNGEIDRILVENGIAH